MLLIGWPPEPVGHVKPGAIMEQSRPIFLNCKVIIKPFLRLLIGWIVRPIR